MPSNKRLISIAAEGAACHARGRGRYRSVPGQVGRAGRTGQLIRLTDSGAPHEAHAVAMSRSYSRAARHEDWRAAVITRHANGQPRTLRLVRTPAQDAAYRRLAL